jgi:ribosomal protein S18 acetylase RimI-like enzyme
MKRPTKRGTTTSGPADGAFGGCALTFGNRKKMMIRAATPDDATDLAKLHVDSWRAAYAGLVPADHLRKLDYEKRSARFREGLIGKTEETYVFDGPAGIHGFVSLGACRDDDVDCTQVGEIWGIYLAPQHWRKGVGSTLCRHAEDLLRSRNYCECVLWVFDGNSQARRFYEAMGFRTDGASKMLNPGAPLKAVRYRKALRSAEPQGGGYSPPASRSAQPTP